MCLHIVEIGVRTLQMHFFWKRVLFFLFAMALIAGFCCVSVVYLSDALETAAMTDQKCTLILDAGHVGEDGGAGHLSLKFPTVTLIVGERECQRGGAVHRRLVGGVVANGIVIDHQVGLEAGVILARFSG